MAGNLTWAKDHFAAYVSKYDRYGRYYDGDHPLKVTDEVMDAFNQVLDGLRDNLCPKVVNALADRLLVEGFSSESEDLTKWANTLWKRLRMDINSPAVHHDACEFGDHYVIVWPSDAQTNTKPGIYPQDTRNIAVRYGYVGEQRVIVEAVKAWASLGVDDKPILRVTRYLPDSIERYWLPQKDSGLPESTDQLRPWDNGPGDEAEWVHNWGIVPVFHFANSMRPARFACSELENVIPMQDLVNQSCMNLFLAGEFYGLPRRWATGLSKQIDTTTGAETTPFTTLKDAIWATADTEVKFGEFRPADLTQLLAALNDYRHETARISDTPEHLFMLQDGDPPSGKALKTAEAPLLAKIEKRQRVWGATWVDVMMLCAQIENVDASAGLDVQWVDVAPYDDLEETEIAKNKVAVGVSKSQVQRELGYTDEQITTMAEETAEDARMAAERAMTAFNGGGGV